MKVLLHNHSSYPAPVNPPSAEASDPAAAIAAAVRDQVACGIDVVTDGQVDRTDAHRRLIDALDGVTAGPRMRYYRTAAFRTVPIVVEAIARRSAIAIDEYRIAAAASARPVKPVLCGPYSTARFARIESGPYTGWHDLAAAFAQALAGEVAALAAAGARCIQLEEPAITEHPEDIRPLRAILEPVWAARGGAEIVVATAGDAAPAYAQLNSLPCDILGLDCTAGIDLPALIAATGASKILALGVVDANSPAVPDARQLATQIVAMLRRYTLDRVALMPAVGLHQATPEMARAKLHVLTAVREQMGELQ